MPSHTHSILSEKLLLGKKKEQPFPSRHCWYTSRNPRNPRAVLVLVSVFILVYSVCTLQIHAFHLPSQMHLPNRCNFVGISQVTLDMIRWLAHSHCDSGNSKDSITERQKIPHSNDAQSCVCLILWDPGKNWSLSCLKLLLWLPVLHSNNCHGWQVWSVWLVGCLLPFSLPHVSIGSWVVCGKRCHLMVVVCLLQ